MKKRTRFRKKDGFTLIITIMLLSMLTVLAIGMLSLGAITLRGGSAAENKRTANANAKMALMLAIGELQKTLGNDMRISADASLLKNTTNQNSVDPQDKLVGVWEGYNPYSDTTTMASAIPAPSYGDDMKKDRFKKWLTSTPNPKEVKEQGYGTGSNASSGALLFTTDHDGFEMRADTVPIGTDGGKKPGAYAWTMVQENTKAKINVGGDVTRLAANDAVQAPSRPDLSVGGIAKMPKKDWATRNNKVVSMKQAVLDSEYGLTKTSVATMGPDYTATAQGVLADVTTGRLKTDLNLAFEMSDTEFKKANWSDIENPFVQGSGEKPLFTPVNGGTPVKFQIAYDTVNYQENFFINSPPTFNTLKSYYQIYQHMYSSTSGPTVFARPQTSTYWTPTQPADRGTETGIGPILDRVLFVCCIYVTNTGQAALVLSPVITLWNPYNVAIEADGYVAYPFIDLPNYMNFTKSGAAPNNFQRYLSQFAGVNPNRADGRQQSPYFYCQITGDGTDTRTKPIHLEPGEVRVCVCSDQTPILFNRLEAESGTKEKNRVIRMKPAGSASDLDIKGGIAYPCNQTFIMGTGLPVADTDSLYVTMDFNLQSFRYGVALEDSTRMTNNYQNKLEGKARFVNEIHVYSNGTNGSITSQSASGATLKRKPVIFGAIDTFHRTANAPGLQGIKATTATADLVYSINPRQRYLHPNIGPSTTFTNGTGPQYDTQIIQGVEFANIGLQVSGTAAYYGETNAPPLGKTHLSFFEVPQEPMLSLAGFQHADLQDVVASPANQFGNSWASPYVEKNLVAKKYARNAAQTGYNPSLGVYDTSYLTNSALWDSYYLSSLAPRTEMKSVSSPTISVYSNPQVSTKDSLSKVIDEWLKDPLNNPLRNPRYVLHRANKSDSEIKAALTAPEGCREISAHLLVDGAFNVNSTSKAAWKAMLASAKNDDIYFQGFGGSGTYKSGQDTAFPRLRMPVGGAMQTATDRWTNFRTLTDNDIDALAEEIVKEVKKRGPFQSMSEFVNRRIVSDADMSLRGAIQNAIDNTSINQIAKITPYSTVPWGATLRQNIKSPADTATGLPFWLTQADVLTGLGPFLTVRSDTFTIRGYGEARDDQNNVLAKSWCEATVQRVPEFVNSKDDAGLDRGKLKEKVNLNFGRRFEIIAFRWVSPEEINPTSSAA